MNIEIIINNNFYIILISIVNEFKYQIFIMHNQGKAYDAFKKEKRKNKRLKIGIRQARRICCH